MMFKRKKANQKRIELQKQLADLEEELLRFENMRNMHVGLARFPSIIEACIIDINNDIYVVKRRLRRLDGN